MPGPFEKLTQIYLRGPEALRLSPKRTQLVPWSQDIGRMGTPERYGVPAGVSLSCARSPHRETSGPLSYREGNCL